PGHRGEHLRPAGRVVTVVVPLVRHPDVDQRVVAGTQPHRDVGCAEYRLTVENVDALFERVDVRRNRTASVEAADPETGVHRPDVLVDDTPAGVARGFRRQRTGVAVLRLGAPADDVCERHATAAFASAAAWTRWSRAASTFERAASTS